MRFEEADTAKAGEEATLVFRCQFMFPQSQHAPAAGAELAGDETVAGLVAGDLGPPELGILFRLRGVERTAVPEAAVNEDGDAKFGEDEVGSDLEWARGFRAKTKRLRRSATHCGELEDVAEARSAFDVGVESDANNQTGPSAGGDSKRTNNGDELQFG